MRKLILLTLSLFTLIGSSLMMSSCSKDDDGPSKPKLSFSDDDETVDEDDGVIEIKVVLSAPLKQAISIDYDLSGTAVEGALSSADYEINGDFGEVEIPAGETEGIIEIEIKDDAIFESNETIEISIDDVSSDDVQITDMDEVVVTIRDNDEQPTVSFSESSVTLSETAGLEEDYTTIEVALDKPAGTDITVTYRLGGSQSAIDSLLAYTWEIPFRYVDYYINGEATVNGEGDDAYTTAEVVIAAGETSANIELAIIPDFRLENDETILLTLESASAGAIDDDNDEFEITLLQDDGLDIELYWDETLNVNMDAFLRYELASNGNEYILDASAFADTDGFEQLFVPKWLDDGEIKLSYTYRQGTANDLDFDVLFIDFAEGDFVDGTEQIFSATYTLENLNDWLDDNGIWPPVVVQTFDIVDGDNVNISGITVPDEGSRVGTKPMRTSGFTPGHRVQRKAIILPKGVANFYKRFKK